MNTISSLFIRGLPCTPFTIVPLFLMKTLTLLFSMIVASRLARGIDFGSIQAVMTKAAGLLAVVTAVNLLDCGIFLAGPIWFFGLMLLFRLDFRETYILTEVNWFMNVIWKLLLLALSL